MYVPCVRRKKTEISIAVILLTGFNRTGILYTSIKPDFQSHWRIVVSRFKYDNA